MVEGFLDGDEFSVLMTDSMTYPAVRKVYLREGALCLDFKADWIDNSYEMVPVKDPELDSRLQAVALQAYKAVHGNSYARADLRIHSATGEICVLEVNSQPGIGDNSTAWDILRGQATNTGRPHHVIAAEFLHQIVTHPRRGLRPLVSTSHTAAAAAVADDDTASVTSDSDSESHATPPRSASSFPLAGAPPASLSLLSSPSLSSSTAPLSPKTKASKALVAGASAVAAFAPHSPAPAMTASRACFVAASLSAMPSIAVTRHSSVDSSDPESPTPDPE